MRSRCLDPGRSNVAGHWKALGGARSTGPAQEETLIRIIILAFLNLRLRKESFGVQCSNFRELD